MNAQTYFSETLPTNLANDPSKAAAIAAVYQFTITGDEGGTWGVDLTKDSDWVTEGDTDAACTMIMADSDFIDLIEGRLPATQAFMLGKLKIEGDMGLAMKLQTILS